MTDKSDNPFDLMKVSLSPIVDCVLDDLGVQDPKKRQAHGKFLDANLKAYLLGKAFKLAQPTLHEGLHGVRELAPLLKQVIEGMRALPLLLQMLLKNSADPEYSAQDWDELVFGLHKFDALLMPIAKAKLPKRLRDEGFDQAVACLMLRIRDITGKLAHAVQADSRYNRSARLASKEAEAIWKLLSKVDPNLTEAQVARRIWALNRRHGAKLEEAYSHYVYIGGRVRLHQGSTFNT
jgi:hypothetical protein